MNTYTIEEKDQIGRELAEILMLKKDTEYPNRYRTTWGTKTALGIFETLKRIGEEIEAGTIEETIERG